MGSHESAHKSHNIELCMHLTVYVHSKGVFELALRPCMSPLFTCNNDALRVQDTGARYVTYGMCLLAAIYIQNIYIINLSNVHAYLLN